MLLVLMEELELREQLALQEILEALVQLGLPVPLEPQEHKGPVVTLAHREQLDLLALTEGTELLEPREQPVLLELLVQLVPLVPQAVL